MAVSQLALRAFRSRRLRDLDALKQLPPAELRFQLRKRGAIWHTEPRAYQKVALLAALKCTSLYLMMDPGVGKTKVAIDAFQTRARRSQEPSFRMLVLVPGLTNVEGWREQMAEHAPPVRFCGLDGGSRAQKLEALEDPNNAVVCITYQGWLALTCRKKRGRKRGLEVDKKEHARLAALFDMVVWDESTFLMSHQSLSFKLARRFAKLVPYRMCLSGTPMDKDPTALWSQFCVLDQGETLGETLGLYRAAYFTEEEDYWAGTTYRFDATRKKELRVNLRNRAIRYRDHECLDLPPISGGLLSNAYMVRTAPWPDENWTYYQELLEELAEVRKDPDRREATYIRMRQVCAGFLPVEDPETGEKATIRFQHNPLLDLLVDLLHELPTDRKVLVYNEFKTSGALIQERLQQEKIPALRLFSGTSDKKAVLRQFKADPKARVLVGSRSVAFGLNLQVANYIAVYDSPDSAIIREQLERRLYRQGQERHVYIWDLVVKNSMGPRILKAIRSGKDFKEELFRSSDPRSLLT